MSQISKTVYASRFTFIPIWSISALVFWIFIRIRALVWLAVLPEGIARVSIALASQTGLMVFVAAAIGGMSLLLWRLLPAKQAACGIILIPVLLWSGSLSLGRIDTQGTDPYVLAPAQRGDVQSTREQLVIKMAQYGLKTELQTLIQAGTNVNAHNPNNQSALYWAREPESIKLLLQASAKPDAGSLRQATFWGRLDAMKLLFAATPDDGKALVAEVGDQALQDSITVVASGEQDRSQMVQLLKARGAKLKSSPAHPQGNAPAEP